MDVLLIVGNVPWEIEWSLNREDTSPALNEKPYSAVFSFIKVLNVILCMPPLKSYLGLLQNKAFQMLFTDFCLCNSIICVITEGKKLLKMQLNLWYSTTTNVSISMNRVVLNDNFHLNFHEYVNICVCMPVHT